VLKNAPNAAWCLDRVKTVMAEDEKPAPQMDEYWVARIEYWPDGGKDLTVVFIHYVWEDGTIDFIPFGSEDGDPVSSTQCAQFELLERIEMEKYK
jgi:hypothetical protein